MQLSPAKLSLSIGKVCIPALADGLLDSLKAKGVHAANVTVAAFGNPAQMRPKLSQNNSGNCPPNLGHRGQWEYLTVNETKAGANASLCPDVC